MNIIETNLSFSSLSKRASTNRIIIHHAEASTCTAEQIHAWHKANGWSGAGYHFLVRKDGKVYRLRPEWAIGAHASGANSDSLGICFEGRYDFETMPAAQLKSGQELVIYLKNKYRINKVQPHRDVTPTSCPGKVFPFDAVAYGNPAPEPEPVPYVPHNVITANYKNDPSQLWWIRGEVKDGSTISLRNSANYLWLSIPGADKKSGTLAQAWEGKNDNKDPREPQEFILSATDRCGVYTLTPKVAQGLRMDVVGANTEPEASVQFYNANKTPAQEFYFYNISDNLYRIISCSGMKPICVS